MKPGALTVLWVLVLVPLALLGWLGYDLAARDREMREYQVQTLIQTQLKSVDASLQNFFLRLAGELRADAGKLPQSPADIRRFVRDHPRLRQVLWFDVKGVRRHPPDTAPLTDKERRFLERTLGVMPKIGKAAASAPSGGLAQPFPAPLPPGEDPRPTQGWFIWHSGSEMVHVFWLRDPARGLIGFELDPLRLLADVIAELPATAPSKTASVQERFRLVDSAGSVAYQWGPYEPQPGAARLGLLPLSAPLASWHLEYYGTGLLGGGHLETFNLVVALVALGAVLLGLGVYLVREHAREVRLAQQRVNFVNQVSHELRTPLTNIRLYAELLDERLVDSGQNADDKTSKYIGVITAECRRLSRLIANVLNFAREVEQDKAVRPEPGCVDDVIHSVLTVFRPTLEAKGIDIQFQPGAPGRVLVDPDALEQILNNLINNIEKYAGGGKRLEIQSRQNGSDTTIRVRDYGPGIPKKERERIFRPFYRISSKLTDGVAGTGIGLSIARQLARRHGGSVTLEPVEPGACFLVRLSTPPAGGAS